MSELEGVDGRLRERLVRAARAQDVLFYSELSEMLKLNMELQIDRTRIGEYLGAVSRYEVAEGRPMLSSIVWYKDMSSPGPGLFKLAIELGLAAQGGDELAFVISELNRTHAYWASH